MTQFKVLVGKLLSVDGHATCTVGIGEVSSLAHKTRNNPMEDGIFESDVLS